MKPSYSIAFLALSSLFLSPGAACADAGWTSSMGLQAAKGSYAGSQLRDTVSSYGLVAGAEHPDGSGLTLGLSHADVNATPGTASTRQDALFASGRMGFKAEELPGRLGLRLDLHALRNDDASGDTNGVRVAAPQISYLSADAARYLDLGYAHSRYRNDLAVRQWTPSVGFAMNKGSDWLQLRGWFIAASNPARAQGVSSTSALEAKWTHWLGANVAGIDKLRASVIVGERIYTVDGDAGSVANLSDLQKGGASFGAEWKVGAHASLLALVGQDRYRNVVLANDYRLNYAYVWLASQW